MKNSCLAEKLMVVLNDDVEEIRRVESAYHVEVLRGGATRANSFQNAMTM